ncbi:MAG: 2-oxoglutarate dehydrogenase E1 component, partial [Gemmataceae bacterium]|nr:2-oxoglutarate dehydrogenase E1 component [Gemmataceae bacterium]
MFMSLVSKAIAPAVNAWSADYLEQQYRAWKADPGSAPADLQAFFQGFELAQSQTMPVQSGAPGDSGDTRFAVGVHALIHAYRSQGHIAAQTDPFGRKPTRPAALSLSSHNLVDADLQRPINTGVTPLPASATLAELIAFLERTYCGPIGVQLAHISDPVEQKWLLDRCEVNSGRVDLSRGQKAHILERLIQAEMFERFLQNRYPGEKRFSLEGGESLIVFIDRVIEAASALGANEMVLGMAHRGRLNVLRNILGKSLEQIFTEFEDAWASLVEGGGDVKYHRGYSSQKQLASGKIMKLVMASNPSHLES